MVKGMGLVQLVRLARARKRRARALLDEPLHRYLDRRILPSRWYPEEDYLALIGVVVRLLAEENGAGDRASVLAELGAGQARQDLEGPYGIMLRRGDPAGTLERLGSLWRLYHDSGRMSAAVQSPGRALVVLEAFPPITGELTAVIGGFVAEALRLAGARDVRVELGDAPRDGARWQLTWAPGDA